MPLLTARPEWAARLAALRFEPCWTVMLALGGQLPLPLDAAQVVDSPLAWIARNNSKPGRGGLEAWVLQATAEWSATHLEDSAIKVIAALTRAFREACGRQPVPPAMAQAHRWRHARAATPLGEDCLWDGGLGLGVCGDWCRGERIEDAWLSGLVLAQMMLEHRRPVVPLFRSTA
ncbi:MAG TPA: hypothetical protein VNN09_09265 [Candidatus Competibacteraceae bacterium]|nr:hypothetical protein [Candidatus Competibacteraceae bacterium]